VVVEDFVLTIPEAIPFQAAAPLLCAGITTYSPLRHWHVTKSTKVGIVGLGGLGHMGVKFARAFGETQEMLDFCGHPHGWWCGRCLLVRRTRSSMSSEYSKI
jgi:D-arabinose 1-dehydrogenase-like Zn-dependent alcohol dehydrogenase